MPRLSTRYALAALAIAVLLSTACGKKRTSASASRKTPSRAAAAQPGTTQTGLASWYGHPYHGRRAANGEVYDMDKMTAAHRTLPFDTLVKVLNLDNQKTVEVRINDRGPFVDGRIIDLSRAAAQQIAMIGPGTAKVRVEVLGTGKNPNAPVKGPPAPPSASPQIVPAASPAHVTGRGAGYAVQIAAFGDARAANELQRRMASRYGSAYIENVRSDQGVLYRVRVGPKPTLAEANQLAASLERENFQPLVVRVDSTPKDC